MNRNLLFIPLFLLGIGNAMATTWSVTQTLDINNLGALRIAINNAASGDTILLNATDTIRLGGVEIPISKNLTITTTAKGEKIISGEGNSRIFNLSTGYTLKLKGITLARGNSTNGGGVSSAGNLIVEDCKISKNKCQVRGGGIYLSGGTATITNSTFSENSCYNTTNLNTYIPYGGGLSIGTGVTASVDKCNFNTNSCYAVVWTVGAGLANEGTLTLTNSTFTGNTLQNTNSNYNCIGAGVANVNGNITMTNCTITSNRIIYGNNVSAGFGGWQSGTTTLKNNIIYGNSFQNAFDSDLSLGQGTTKTSAGYNLLGTIVTGFTTVSSDITGINPNLSTYGSNGGTTYSYAIGCTSAAWGKGDPSSAGTVSQNGVSRSSRVDIGAYQWSGTLPSVSVTATDPSCNGGSNGSATVNSPNGAYSYSWTGGASGNTVSGLSPGTYYTKVTDQNGCYDSSAFIINNPLAITISGTVTDDMGGNSGSIDIVVSNASGKTLNYLWTPGFYTTQNISNLSAGSYSVLVTDSKGCEGSETFTVSAVTGSKKEIDSAIKIFPNPTYGMVTIMSEESVLSAQLINMNGKILLSTTEKELNLSGFDSGVYILKIQLTGEIVSKLITIQ